MVGAHLFPVQEEYSQCMLMNFIQPFYSATWFIQLPCTYQVGANVLHLSQLKLCSAFIVLLIGMLALKQWLWRWDGRNVGGSTPG